MALLVWSEQLPDWQRDALRRIAGCESISDADKASVLERLRHAHGIAVEAPCDCVPLADEHLPVTADGSAATILCGIGPVQNVDRLAPDQELRFAVDGITLIYGENGSGKSGYTRIAKKLCRARVVDELHGDVFAEERLPPPDIRIRYRTSNAAEPHSENWRDGDPGPSALSRMMVLDTASSRVYVDGQNEITFLPREIEIITRLGGLCTALALDVQREVDALTYRCRGSHGAAYTKTTEAGRLISLLAPETPLRAIPSEDAVRAAAAWDANKETKLAALESELAQDPALLAAGRRRAAAVLNALADDVDGVAAVIGDDAASAVEQLARAAGAATRAAALSAEERFANGYLRDTGSETWKLMFGYARAFAAQSGLKTENDAFEPGDACPACQTPLDATATERLRQFDDFIRSTAAIEAAAANDTLQAALESIRALSIPVPTDIDRNLAEYRAFGEVQVRLCDDIRSYAIAAIERRFAMLATPANRTPLPSLSATDIRAEASRLSSEADSLDAQPRHDPRSVARVNELKDAQRLAADLDAVLTRRVDLELRQRLMNCKSALDTRAISQFATRRRRELITPELRGRIEAEATRLDLGHIPLRFEEASDHGRNFFDMVLDTRQQAAKSRILSEGEQRALGIACFLAEMHRVPGGHGIIVDDPVSSLDHQRLRKVAERLVEEAGTGRQVIIFTHNLVFYQEVLAAAGACNPQVRVLVNLVSRANGRFGIVSEDDEPWIAKKVTERVNALRARFGRIPASIDRNTDEYRRLAKDFYTDLRETWERLVEEVLLAGVVERFNSGIKTQNLKGVVVEDRDYQIIFAAMSRVSERSGHDMAAGRQIPVPDIEDMRRDLQVLDDYRNEITRRRNRLQDERRALEEPPVGRVA